MKKTLLACCALLPILILTGCTNTIKYDDEPASKTVEQDLGAETLQSSTLSMMETMLTDSKVQKVTQSSRPMLAVFGMINFTNDAIDLATLNNQLMTELNKSNRFRYVDLDTLAKASLEWQGRLYELFEEPSSSQQFADAVNADFLLIGEISNIIRTSPNSKKVYYRLTLKLLDKSKGAFIWLDQRELLKSEKSIVYGV